MPIHHSGKHADAQSLFHCFRLTAANHNLHPAAIFRLSLYIITERTVISIHWQCYIRDTANQFSVYKIL